MKNLKIAAASIAVCTSMFFTACGAASVEFIHSTHDSNGKFTCEMLDVGADFGSDWTFLTDEEIAKLNGAISAENEDLKAAFEANAALQDMMVTMESGTNVNLVYENTNKTTAGSVSESEYLDMSVDQLKQQLSASMDNVSSKKTTVKFAGENRSALDMSAEYMGVLLYERLIPIRNGNYMGVFTITAFSEDELDDVTEMFYALD